MKSRVQGQCATFSCSADGSPFSLLTLGHIATQGFASDQLIDGTFNIEVTNVRLQAHYRDFFFNTFSIGGFYSSLINFVLALRALFHCNLVLLVVFRNVAACIHNRQVAFPWVGTASITSDGLFFHLSMLKKPAATSNHKLIGVKSSLCSTTLQHDGRLSQFEARQATATTVQASSVVFRS